MLAVLHIVRDEICEWYDIFAGSDGVFDDMIHLGLLNGVALRIWVFSVNWSHTETFLSIVAYKLSTSQMV